MFRQSFIFRSCPHLTGYAAFAQVAFKMPIMQTVPGGLSNKSKVSHEAWRRLGETGRSEYSSIGQSIKISAIKKQKRTRQMEVSKFASSYLCRRTTHPGWRQFVQRKYHSKEVQQVPFEERLDKLSGMHLAYLREKRRLRNLELRRARAALNRRAAVGAKRKRRTAAA